MLPRDSPEAFLMRWRLKLHKFNLEFIYRTKPVYYILNALLKLLCVANTPDYEPTYHEFPTFEYSTANPKQLLRMDKVLDTSFRIDLSRQLMVLCSCTQQARNRLMTF